MSASNRVGRLLVLFLSASSVLFSAVCAQEDASTLPQVAPWSVGYEQIESYSWDDVFTICARNFPAPLTANYPIQPAHSPDIVFVDAAGGVTRLRALPDVDHSRYIEIEERPSISIRPLFGTTPTLADVEKTKLRVDDKSLPFLNVSYRRGSVCYEADYCAASIDEDVVVAVRFVARNVGETSETAAIWLKTSIARAVGRAPGEGLLTYHYSPFGVDKTSLFPTEGLDYRNGSLYYYGARFGEVDSSDFTVDFPDATSFTEEEKRVAFDGDLDLAPDELSESIRALADLAPNESATLEFKFAVDYEAPRNPKTLDLDFATIRRIAEENFVAATSLDDEKEFATTLKFAQDARGDVLKSLRKQLYQTTLQFPGSEFFVPTQGSNSQYHYVWTWETLFALRPLIATGDFDLVRRAVEYLLSFQDRFYPEGRFNSLDGAIGSNAIRWGNSTGCTLLLAADYYRYSRDEDFLEKNLPAMLRAARWIIGEIRATRTLDANGERPANYGVMPFARGCDGTVGYNLTLTDGYTWAGLDGMARLLEQIDAPEKEEFRAEVEQYRRDILEALKHTTDEEGFVYHQLTTEEPGEVLSLEFESSDGIHQLAYCGLIDPATDAFRKYLEIYERDWTRGFFFSPYDSNQAYLGTGELDAQIVYYRLGQWKKAFAALQTLLLYGKTEETDLVQERYSNPRYLPFQPNPSENGRILAAILNSVVFQYQASPESDEISTILLAGVPWRWLVENDEGLELKNLHLPGGGRLSVAVEKIDEEHRLLTVEIVDDVTPRRFLLPDFLAVESVDGALEKIGAQEYRLVQSEGGVAKAEFVIKDGEKR